MSEKIYVIGHKSPDLDSVAGAIAYASYKNASLKTDAYTPAVCGEVNQETKYALEKFGFEVPAKLENASGEKIILVDHNEFSQSVDGVEEAEIVEVLDHHKVNFGYGRPIPFTVLPWGASCSIITKYFFDNNLEINKNLAGLMLSAILVDTVITKSPTTTENDVRIIEQLSKLSEIEDWETYGVEIFKVRSNVSELSAEEIIKGDFKDFELGSGKFGIGQVETADLSEFDDREAELLDTLEKMKSEGDYHTVILFITDIMKEGSRFLVASQDKEKLGEALGGDLSENKAFIPGIMSRKKQVAPKIEEKF